MLSLDEWQEDRYPTNIMCFRKVVRSRKELTAYEVGETVYLAFPASQEKNLKLSSWQLAVSCLPILIISLYIVLILSCFYGRSYDLPY